MSLYDSRLPSLKDKIEQEAREVEEKARAEAAREEAERKKGKGRITKKKK